MAKKTTTKKAPAAKPNAGYSLVIVESPSKAKTINKYLGKDYVVKASVGHIRDLVAKNPKGVKRPVPGVDLENNFEPDYEISADKKKVMTELKKLLKGAGDVYLATDLDREGEAIAWHLAEALGLDSKTTKRVEFNEITKNAITASFKTPRILDMDRVDAQQARRILDRIVGYMASPYLWKKVAGGLSAGRVQSVAVRLLAEREQEIRDHMPDESWSIDALLTADNAQVAPLAANWRTFVTSVDSRGKTPTVKGKKAWLAEQGVYKAELVEVKGKKVKIETTAAQARNLTGDVLTAAEAAGLANLDILKKDNPKGKGLAKIDCTLTGELAPGVSYKIDSIEKKPRSVRPYAPFITSTLQMSGSSQLGMPPSRTMRAAQKLYEAGHITYMRTDATTLSEDAIKMARGFITDAYGERYLPEKPVRYNSSDKSAQEAHEAIRPTRVDTRNAGATADEKRVYDLIWRRYVSCQMVPAVWENTTIRLVREDKNTGAVLRASGRMLSFDGFYKANGIPTGDAEGQLPVLAEGDTNYPFNIHGFQQFSKPPARYSEASLIKKMESEGIGRPSTYASIIETIKRRQYVEADGSSLRCTAVGEKVTEKLIEALPDMMALSYTRRMEEELDIIAAGDLKWRDMLRKFYDPFNAALEHASENIMHAKAEAEPAPYDCPKCNGETEYRFGRNGRFLGCTNWKSTPITVHTPNFGECQLHLIKGKPVLMQGDTKVSWVKVGKEEKLRIQALVPTIIPGCDYITNVDADGKPQVNEIVDIICPEDGQPMLRRKGRFGPFLAASTYPDVKFILKINQKTGAVELPKPPAFATSITCGSCKKAHLLARNTKRGLWMYCSSFPKCRGRGNLKDMEQADKDALQKAVNEHEANNQPPEIFTADGLVITSDMSYVPQRIEQD